ncbi:MAG TPA: AAA family ATPase [Gaiellaceae bacterium]
MSDDRFSIETARELCELPDPPDEDRLLGDLAVAGQRIVIGGHTGEGKTTLTLQIVKVIVTGESFLGWQRPMPDYRPQALIIDAEQGLRTIKRRLRETGLADSDDVHYLRLPDGLSLDIDVETAKELDSLLNGAGYDVVVFDPLYKLHAGDSNDEFAAKQLMRIFDAWRERDRFALILPVHLRKPLAGSRLSIHDIFGSSAYVRGAEVVVGITRASRGYAHLHFFKDRDGDLEVGAKWGLLFDREHGYRRDPNADHERDLTAEIQAWLEQNPNSTGNAVVKGIGAGKARVTEILKNDPRFSFQPGANNSKLWVVSSAENHPDHPEPLWDVSGSPVGGLSLESHQGNHHRPPGAVVSNCLAEEDWLEELARTEEGLEVERQEAFR